jgi:hypothetical protein
MLGHHVAQGAVVLWVPVCLCPRRRCVGLSYRRPIVSRTKQGLLSLARPPSQIKVAFSYGTCSVCVPLNRRLPDVLCSKDGPRRPRHLKLQVLLRVVACLHTVLALDSFLCRRGGVSSEAFELRQARRSREGCV